jgi:prepilin-type N-terminal cleavage/methylation domain-containing protein
MRTPLSQRLVPRRLRRADGFTLIELIVVMTILATVMTPLIVSFSTSMKHDVDQTRREQAYANARIALQRLRVDVHCASNTVPQINQNSYGGFTLTLSENHQGQDGWCPGVIPAGDTSSGVQWCTVPKSGSTTRFVLYRYIGTDLTECGSTSASTFQVDYVAITPSGWPTNSSASGPPTGWVGNLWPTAATCVTGNLPTVAFDVNVAVDPVNFPNERYELRDQIAIRNANRCS